ncbi:COG4315 family predicted lipoprotein [Jatrophihabitans sp. DSM 45814]
MKVSSAARGTRLAKYGLPLAALGILATACSSSGGGDNPTVTTPAAAGSTAASAPAAAAQAGSIMVTNGHLTDASGRTLYLWVADTGAASTCSGACAMGWPPVPASGTPTAGSGVTATDLTVIKRTDGSSQLAYAGHPLYYFVGDKAAGDANGQGSSAFGAKWWEVNSSGAAITAAAIAPPASAPAPAAPASSSASSGGGYGY